MICIKCLNFRGPAAVVFAHMGSCGGKKNAGQPTNLPKKKKR